MNNEHIKSRFMTNMKKLGVESLEELPLYLPKDYKDYNNFVTQIAPYIDNSETRLFKLKILSQPKINKEKKYVSLFLGDGVTTVSCTFFFIRENLTMLNKGDIVYIDGSVERKGKFVSFTSPTLVESYQLGKLFPFYKGEPGVVNTATIATNIQILLRDNLDEFVMYIARKYHITDADIQKVSDRVSGIADLFTRIHMPFSKEDSLHCMDVIKVINARSALYAALSHDDNYESIECSSPIEVSYIKYFVEMLTFNLTPSQKQSVWDICRDLMAKKRMDRLLSGDVGYGKTLTYGIPAACNQMAGKSTVIMTPNTLLSAQIAKELVETFNLSNVHLFVGDSEKASLEELGNNPIIVGTTAIIHWAEKLDKKFSPDFLIIDEQQKLGNEQKLIITDENTNVLEATATAIPRTQALVTYGSKKVSYLLECPVEKQIKTVIVGKEKARSAFKTLKKIVDSGKQIAILYPIKQKDYMFYEFSSDNNDRLLNIAESISSESVVNIDGKNHLKLVKAEKTKLEKTCSLEGLSFELIEKPDIESKEDNKRNVESAYKLWDEIYPGQVAMLHGGLKAAEKDEALRRAKEGEVKVIITTSVIEIGLTIPNLQGFYVKNADRYGASTLHQFRGRLARKGGRGLFIMGVDCHTSEMSKKSKDRLELLVKYERGYDIAVEDMRQRGFGDLERDGTIQSGNLDGMFKGLKVTPDDVSKLVDIFGGADNLISSCQNK